MCLFSVTQVITEALTVHGSLTLKPYSTSNQTLAASFKFLKQPKIVLLSRMLH